MRKGIWLCLLAASSWAQEGMKFRGRVVDERDSAVAYVNVFLKDGDFAGDVSDDQGQFEIRTNRGGERKLVASMLGYEMFEKAIVLPVYEPLKIVLREKAIALSEVQVEASAYVGGEGKATLTKIDVYTTPGGAADVFQSLKALPGITQSDESAGLPVRGGHPSETIVLINHATLRHPYRSENTSGTGLFSVIETATMKKMYFSSGAFSVKYGNALSGVLDIETESRVEQNRIQMDLNLVSGGFGVRRNLVPEKLNVQVYGKHTSTDLLFRVNKQTVDVIEDPQSTSGTGLLTYTYSPTGTVQLLTLLNSDDQKLEIPILAARQDYSLETGHEVVALTWSDLIRKNVLVKTSVASSRYSNRWRFGAWFGDDGDRNAKGRADLQWDVSPDFGIAVGAEAGHDDFRFRQLVPRRRGEYFAGADSAQIDGKSGGFLVGSYVELKRRLSARWTILTGVRHDYSAIARRSSADVRGGVVHEVAADRFVRFGAGTFHQFPETRYYDPAYSDGQLKVMQAKHLVMGFEQKRSTTEFRTEAYIKWYRDLPLENPDGRLTSDGSGFAYGADVFWKLRWKRVSGWISYSAIRTRRKEWDVATLRPTPYDITHNLKLVQKTALGKGFECSSTFRYASGRPITPILGGTDDGSGNMIPQYGSRYGDRLPPLVRLDTRLSKYFFFSDLKYLVLYIEVMNALNTHNVLDYSYSADFSERQKILSYFGNRTIVAGFSLSL